MGQNFKKDPSVSTLSGDCKPASSQTDLDLNNVRAAILNGGDMWWNLTDQKYEVPKGSNRHSLFAGALWIGGIDAGGQLKVAAMNYRQGGNDFFPGPVDPTTTSTAADICAKYDKHWKVTRQEVEDFALNHTTPSQSLVTWPGAGNNGAPSYGLAPFYDADGDGVYSIDAGDYPYYDLTGKVSCKSCGSSTFKDVLYGDQTIWWVFNDVGNVHTETGGEPIGLEIQAQAFAFSTNDEINDMTFYNYKIINRSTFSVSHTYFGQWVDPDLGNGGDDYVGCDVSRGLGYCYNGEEEDKDGSGQFAGEKGYGANPPAVGLDFFQGPLADAGDGIDNNRNCQVDEPCEQIIMSKFVYYNNDGSLTGEPGTAKEFYGYLKGEWKDGTKMTYSGNGHLSGGTQCNFMFPGTSDQKYNWGTGGTCTNPGGSQANWDEVTAGNQAKDRRFIQSAGEFTLQPGAVNYITTGAVWARASQGGRLASLELLKLADDKAQALFNNCFKVLDGPDAPDMAIRELDKQIILSISNKSTSNNANEAYSEVDPLIVDTTAIQTGKNQVN